MKYLPYVIAALIILALLVKLVPEARKKVRRGSFGKKRLATPREQTMFWRLVEAFPGPEHIVLAQVSFGALLVAKNGASRYSFSQKIADFVLMDKSFTVLAVIELDDSSHRGRELDDGQRDDMLIEAGYKVLRYPGVPEVARLRNDVKTPTDLPPMTAER